MRLAWSAVFIPCLIATSAANIAAQQPGTGTDQLPNDSIARYNLDALVVSVLGTPITVGRSPFAVSAADRDDLREGKTGMFMEEALRGLPGVQVQNRFNYAVGERVSVRGFGSRAQFGVRGIHVVVDGIPATLPDGQSTLDHVDISSLGRVEALRGPASALYGNAAGGVLRFTTEIPPQVPLRQEVTAVGGTHGMLRLQSTTAGTVGSTGYLVSLNRLSLDGFRRAPAGAAYGEATRLHLNTRLEQEVGRGSIALSFNHLDLDAENPGSLRLDQFEEDPRQVFVPAYISNGTGKEVQQSQLGITYAGVLGPTTAELAVYGLTRDFLNPLPGDVVDVDRRAGGARLAVSGSTQTDDVEIDLNGGVEVDLQNDDRREYTNDGGRPDILQQNQTETVRGIGLFLQGSVALQDRVDLLAGIRYDRSRFKVEDLFTVTPGVNEDDSGSRTMDAFSPTIGAHVSVIPELGVFANFATSFETPTTVELGNRESGSGGFNPDLDPMSGKTFEVGIRGSVQERLSYEATYFNTKLENELIPFENPDQLTYYRNAGSSTRNGAEAVVWAQLHELVTAQASYAYTDAKFDDYVLDGEDLAGKKVPGLAPQQGQASLRVGPAAWFIEAGVDHTGEVAVNDDNSAAFADSYTLFGARAGLSGVRLGSIELSPFAGVQNLTDETYISSVTVNAFGSRYYEPGPGRTFYVGGTVAVSR
jgi:iron complex outermembrane receptor protein